MNPLILQSFLSLSVVCGRALVIPSKTATSFKEHEKLMLHDKRSLSNQQLQEHNDMASPIQLLTLISDLMGAKEPRIIAANKNLIDIPLGDSSLVTTVGSILASVVFALIVWAIFISFIAEPPTPVNRNDHAQRQGVLNLIQDTVLRGIKQQDERNQLTWTSPHQPLQPENTLQAAPNQEVAPNLPYQLRTGRPAIRPAFVNQVSRDIMHPQDRRPESISQPIFKNGNKNRNLLEQAGPVKRRIDPNRIGSWIQGTDKHRERTRPRSPQNSHLAGKQNLNQDISLTAGNKKHFDRKTHDLQQLLLDPKHHNSEETDVTYYFEIPGSLNRPPNPIRRRPYRRPENDVTYYYEVPPKFLNPIPNRWKSSAHPLRVKSEEAKILNDNSLPNNKLTKERNDVLDNIEYVDHPEYSVLSDYTLLDDYEQDEYSDNEIAQEFYLTTMNPNHLRNDNTDIDLEDNADPFDEVNYSFFPFSDEVAINWMPDKVQKNKDDKKEMAIENESEIDKEYLS